MKSIVTILLAGLVAGCSGPGPADEAPSGVASIQLELTMLPDDAACVQVTVKGSTTAVRTFDAGPRGRSVVSLDGLPTGTVTISGVAFDRPCAGIAGATPTWTADPVSATLSTSAPTTVTLSFQRGGRVRLNADFPADTAFVKQAATGGNQTCAVTRDGMMRCWGFREAGQVGDGVVSSVGQFRPLVVSREKFLQVAAGDEFTCGLLANGTVTCWGGNAFGMLGDGTFSDRAFAAVPVVDLTDAVQIAAGQFHACAVRATGTVVCWGHNFFGALGTPGGQDSSVPVAVPGLAKVVQVAGGLESSYAVTAAGLVYSWGGNFSGQLGDGTTTNRFTPQPIVGLTNVVQVAGSQHACARIADGTVRCWGRNDFGQVGDGTTIQRLTPVPVSGLTNVTDVTCMFGSTLAARADGSARSWGLNDFGSLGDGTTTNRLTPVTISGLTTVDHLAVAQRGSTACAIIADGGMRCWGPNDQGQVGDNTDITRLVPTAPLF